MKPGYATRSKVDLTVEVKKTELEGSVEKEIGVTMKKKKRSKYQIQSRRKKRNLKVKKFKKWI